MADRLVAQDLTLENGWSEFWDEFRPGDVIVRRTTRQMYEVEDPPFTSRGKLRFRKKGSVAQHPQTAWWTTPGKLPGHYYARRKMDG